LKRAALFISLVCSFALASQAQRLALLQPNPEGAVPGFAQALKAELSKRLRLVDEDLAAAAFRSVPIQDPFNMSAEEGRSVGVVIGSERFVIVRSALQRRAGSGGRSYFEAYAAIYLVEARTGLLIRFELPSAEADTESETAARLLSKTSELAATIVNARSEQPTTAANFPEPPPENSPEAAGLKLPNPYKRIRPEYTATAALYGIKATVDIEVDIDTEGRIAATRIVRWAGFGLDDAVERAVRSMNWRPAMRNGKSLPMRVLLRYNFRKVEADEKN
jgi:TonB family protein